MHLSELHARNAHDLTSTIIERALRDIPAYRNLQLSPEGLFERVFALVQAFSADLDEPNPHLYRERLAQASYTRAVQGLSMEEYAHVVTLGHEESAKILLAAFAHDPEQQFLALQRCFAVAQSGLVGLYSGYERLYVDTIDTQRAAYQEAITPIIPLTDDVLVVPLVGALDPARVQNSLEVLLDMISKYQARIVILDITGVQTIDTYIANALIHAARAVALLGTQLIITGVRPEIAHILVNLGIDLRGMTTYATLQAAIGKVLRLS